MCKHIHMYGMLPADTIDIYIPWPTQIVIVWRTIILTLPLRKLKLERKINVEIIVILHEELHFRIPFTMFKGFLMDRNLDLGRQETEWD